jgi:hypothetical protein
MIIKMIGSMSIRAGKTNKSAATRAPAMEIPIVCTIKYTRANPMDLIPLTRTNPHTAVEPAIPV